MARQWTEKENQYLRDNIDKLSYATIGKKFNRTHRAVGAQAQKLGILQIRPWSKADEQIIINEYPTAKIDEICKKLNRTTDSIFKKAGELGIAKQFNYHSISKEYLIKNYVELKRSINTIANELGVTVNLVFCAMQGYKIPCDKPSRINTRGLWNLNRQWKGYGEISSSKWGGYKKSAKERGLSFNIDMEYAWNIFVKQGRKCALSGVTLTFPTRQSKQSSATASLDRIDSSKGYIEGNVQWVHKDVNFMKRCISNEQFIEFCFNVVKHQGLICDSQLL